MLSGAGYDSAGTSGQLNDLSMFDPTAGQWTWVAGSNKANQYGTFGTQGKTASTNVISARSGAATWVDQSGNFWLFGGEGFDINNNYSYLNDMWTLNPQNGEATWVAGLAVGDAAGVGTLNTAGASPATNSPTGRAYATTWVDSNHVFWLFGGQTVNSSSGSAYTLDDLWSYDPNAYNATTHPNGGKGWIWVSGTPNSNTKGSYPSAAGIIRCLRKSPRRSPQRPRLGRRCGQPVAIRRQRLRFQRQRWLVERLVEIQHRNRLWTWVAGWSTVVAPASTAPRESPHRPTSPAGV